MMSVPAAHEQVALTGVFDAPGDRRARFLLRIVLAAHWASGTGLIAPTRFPALGLPEDVARALGVALVGCSALGSVMVWTTSFFRPGAALAAVAIAAAGALHAPAFAHHRAFFALLLALGALAPREGLGRHLRLAFALLYFSAAGAKVLEPAYRSGDALTHLLTLLSGGPPLYAPGVAVPAPEAITHVVSAALLPFATVLSWMVVLAELIVGFAYAAPAPRGRWLAWPLHLGILWCTGSPFGTFLLLGLLAPWFLREDTHPAPLPPRTSFGAFVAALALASVLAHPLWLTLFVPVFLAVFEATLGRPNTSARAPS